MSIKAHQPPYPAEEPGTMEDRWGVLGEFFCENEHTIPCHMDNRGSGKTDCLKCGLLMNWRIRETMA